MSERYEWVGAEDCSINTAGAGTWLGEHTTEGPALILGHPFASAFVIEAAEPGQLVELARTLLSVAEELDFTEIDVLVPEALFPLGTVVATPGAIERMERYGMRPAELLARHVSGDWGDIHPDDRGLNEEALRHDDRLLSVYGEDKTDEDSRIWIITEADRSATTLLRPEDY